MRNKVALALVVVFFILCIGAIVKAYSFFSSIQTVSSKKSAKKVPPKNTYNFLLMGYGGGAHEGTYLTDTIMTLHINTLKKTAALISIPRDTWVKLPTRSKKGFSIKINATYQTELFPQTFPDVDTKSYKKEGEGAFTKKVIEQISGQPIDAFVAVDFSAFQTIIDTIGGIDVYVDRSFKDEEYPIEGKEKDLCNKETEDKFNQIKDFLSPTPDAAKLEEVFKDKDDLKTFYTQIKEEPYKAFPCRYETLEFQAGMNHMNGETALKYSRSRHSLEDGGDFNRARRQHKVLDAVKTKLMSALMVAKIPSLLDDVSDHVETDVSNELAKRLLKEVPDIKNYSVTRLIISTDNYLTEARSEDGQYILIPKEGMFKWGRLQKDIQKVLNGISLTPTPKLKKAKITAR